MFELSVARKYLTPTWRQLSVSIISLISIGVIALVVWLIVVFFSVTNGLEKSWVDKLVALTAPVRVSPTDEYYRSYYHRIDSISSGSDYNLKSIQEKLASPLTDPYDPNIDEELPAGWPKPDLDAEGKVKDPVKLAYQIFKQFPDITASDYEMTGGTLNLRLLRNIIPVTPLSTYPSSGADVTVLNQPSYLGSFDPDNQMIQKVLLPVTMKDLNNLYGMLGVASDNQQETNADTLLKAPPELLRSRLKAFFDAVDIHELMTPPPYWAIPASLLPSKAQFEGYALYRGKHLLRIILATTPFEEDPNLRFEKIQLSIDYDKLSIISDSNNPVSIRKTIPILLPGYTQISARLDTPSLANATNPYEVQFNVNFTIQGVNIKGLTSLGHLIFSQADIKHTYDQTPEISPLWFYSLKDELGEHHQIPSDPLFGDGIILPRPFREAGVTLGDRGFLSYGAPTASSIQEQRIPVFVAGFYEPGIIPTGGKYLLVDHHVTNLIRASQNQDSTGLGNGINIRFADLEKAGQIKRDLQQAFEKAGIAAYWKIETYKEYDYTKDIIQQLGSEKNLFTLISAIIIIVACSNIISMLIILVNDKKVEIGILRSMGASSINIATIFGICGIIMGIAGSLLGIFAAAITLRNLQPLINLISRIQGHEMFNPLFFGDTLPSELSYEALTFVIIATALISLFAGLVPAIKASLMNPSTILRSE